MPSPRVLIVRAPGTNCDAETARAFERAGAVADRLHLLRVLEEPGMLDRYQILCVPGGFSYGDDLGAGVIFARHLTGPLGGAFGRFLEADKLVLGICNGFQVLLRAGVLPGGAESWGRIVAGRGEPRRATLTWNESGRYDCRWVRCRVDRPDHAFLRGLEDVELPIAHAEGRLAVSEPAVLDEWTGGGHVALRYAPPHRIAAGRRADAGRDARRPGQPERLLRRHRRFERRLRQDPRPDAPPGAVSGRPPAPPLDAAGARRGGGGAENLSERGGVVRVTGSRHSDRRVFIHPPAKPQAAHADRLRFRG